MAVAPFKIEVWSADGNGRILNMTVSIEAAQHRFRRSGSLAMLLATLRAPHRVGHPLAHYQLVSVLFRQGSTFDQFLRDKLNLRPMFAH
jgi:hypothetical protein